MPRKTVASARNRRGLVIHRAILQWGLDHRRNFPWRASSDPYRVLIAELLLHRTQARQVAGVYETFIQRYPTIQSLADADPRSVLALTHGLGLQWRSALLVQAAREIVEVHGGRIPEDRLSLMELPGVSEYVAGAVRCFAWGHPEPILDTNTVRVAGRVFGMPVRDSSRRSSQFRGLVGLLIDPDSPRESGWALLDLGAELCRPVNPECGLCPLQPFCAYARKGRAPRRLGPGPHRPP